MMYAAISGTSGCFGRHKPGCDGLNCRLRECPEEKLAEGSKALRLEEQGESMVAGDGGVDLPVLSLD